MKHRTRILVLAALSSFNSMLVAGCASHSRPPALVEAAHTRQTPQAHEAAELAPATFAEAEKYRRDAERAYNLGDLTRAQLLGECATAAYEQAFANARSVRATQALDQARSVLTVQEHELSAVRETGGRLNAEVNDLELRIKVARDAQPLSPSGRTIPARENARWEAVRALGTEASLLCVTTRLISSNAQGNTEAESSLTQLNKILETAGPKRTAPAPIDLATRARAQCLSALTQARRSAEARVNDTAAIDTLLADLSREGSFSPVRDERGVVVTLYEPFVGSDLSKEAEASLSALGKVSQAHATMPLLLVMHDATEPRQADHARDTKREETLKKTLSRDTLELIHAGTSRPVVDPQSKDKHHNERIELVFIDRGAG